MGKTIKNYNAEFKQDAVNHYHSSGKSIQQVAKSLKLCFTRIGSKTKL